MSNKDMKHWGYDLLCALCLLILFIIGISDYNVLLYPNSHGRGSSIGALIRLLTRLSNSKVVLSLLLIIAIIFVLKAYRKWKKSDK